MQLSLIQAAACSALCNLAKPFLQQLRRGWSTPSSPLWYLNLHEMLSVGVG